MSKAAAFDLEAIARQVAIERGFETETGSDVAGELAALTDRAPSPDVNVRDLRNLLWSSIDNRESRDLDQVEVAEQTDKGSIRLLIAIADVDSQVPKGSAIDARARHNCTSVYTGVAVFPMLPRQLSEARTSLLPDQDKLAIVIETVVDLNGVVTKYDLYRALVRNHAKLVYEDVGAWLEGGAVTKTISGVEGLIAQLRLQRDAARRLKAERLRAGALELDTIEARPVTKDGKVVDLAITRKNLARDLIEDFMIAANIATARFLEDHKSSGIRRVVREPERWSRIVDVARERGYSLPPEPDSLALATFLSKERAKDELRFPDLSLTIVKLLGRGEYALDLPGKDPGIHFGLAAHDYTHATAPNRRYADLIQQRLVKAVLASKPQPYSDAELTEIAKQCTDREDAAQKVERQMRKVAAALMLSDRLGHQFDAIVTGVNPKGTYVRLLRPPAEGKVVRGEKGMDVGDRVKVKLVHVDPERGHIDFAGNS